MQNKKRRYMFTSESVSEGHPDKMCDQVSDALLDAFIEQDPDSRVAIECFTKTGFIIVGGEVTSKAHVDVQEIVRKTIKDIGYDSQKYGFDGNTCGVIVCISEQSGDIAQGVNVGEGLHEEQGAGDQGIMFGYATNETPEYMPLPIVLAHKLVSKQAELRKKGELAFLGPDAKSQVTIEYENGKPLRVDTIVVSTQHDEDVSLDKVREEVLSKIVKPVCGNWLDDKTIYHINPTGKFVIGGPVGDAGLTGRKIIVDTYGGHGSHGGGAFSGKDPSKVDRSGAYMARYVAKNVVAAGLADKCEVQFSYAIGVAEPISVLVNCFSTERVDEEKISELVRKYFPLKPADMVKELDLKKPIFKQTAAYGHFGREGFSWEKLDKVDVLKKEVQGLLHAPAHTGEEVALDA